MRGVRIAPEVDEGDVDELAGRGLDEPGAVGGAAARVLRDDASEVAGRAAHLEEARVLAPLLPAGLH